MAWHGLFPQPIRALSRRDAPGIKEPQLPNPSGDRDTFAKRMDLLFGQCRPNKKSAYVRGYNASVIRPDKAVDYTAQFPG